MELLRKRCWLAIYWLSVAGFLLCVANAFKPGYGFTGLIQFGDRFGARGIAGLHCYIEPKSAGYDGQFYAKLALDPLVQHPADDEQVIDNLYYRSKRIFSSWTAWALGLGRPAWIMQVYAMQNVACWLVLAWVLTRWFPPLDFNNYVRWAGILFSLGLTQSVRSSLTDGPSFLFITLGLAFCERNRGTWAAGMFAIAGLTRETSLLAFAALIDPAKRSPRDLGRLALLGVLTVAPLLCWMAYIHLHLEQPDVVGKENLALPFAGWAQKWGVVFSMMGKNRWGWLMLLLQVSLTAQAFFLFAWPAFSKPAWRIGVVFAVLMLCLGFAVWDGFPGAASRTVLPMLLGFNILVPRGRWWLALLLAGNLSAAYQPLIENGVPGDVGVVRVSGPGLETDGREFTLRFGPEWYGSERGFLQTWRRWSPGTAAVTIDNPNPFAIEANLGMSLSAKRGDNRAMTLELNGRPVWTGTLTDQLNAVRAGPLRLEPGENTLVFKTTAPAAASSGGRLLAFCLRDLEIDVLSRAAP